MSFKVVEFQPQFMVSLVSDHVAESWPELHTLNSPNEMYTISQVKQYEFWDYKAVWKDPRRIKKLTKCGAEHWPYPLRFLVPAEMFLTKGPLQVWMILVWSEAGVLSKRNWRWALICLWWVLTEGIKAQSKQMRRHHHIFCGFKSVAHLSTIPIRGCFSSHNQSGFMLCFCCGFKLVSLLSVTPIGTHVPVIAPECILVA